MMLEFAVELAYRAGALLRAGFERELVVTEKGRADPVSEVDKASEALILGAIRERFPNHAILAEESGAHAGAAEYTWVIDPIDGTINYVHHLPHAAVSIGLLRNGELFLGAVFDPFRSELFAGQRGQGAFLNGRRIAVSPVSTLRDALLLTGFPYARFELVRNNLAEHNRLLMLAQEIRRSGSAALDLCYVAAGRCDGYWELGLGSWDTVAGALIAIESGARLSDWRGAPWPAGGPEIVVSNGLIHGELIAALAP
jgi:myo-inositol-1(or 4)-monophosphatase